MIIRPISETDVPDVARIHIASWQAAYRGIVPDDVLDAMDVVERTERWGRRFDAIRDTMFVAEVDGSVAAWVLCGASREADDPASMGEIYAIYADPEVWGRGLGTALLSRAQECLKARGSAAVFLWVLTDNMRGRRFYESCGYQATAATKQITIAGADLTELRYERNL